ncbi:hypothetical protein J6590_013614 [Homalodisca vitripennis]|nr:hypothetical protein J6590_013614 [Homalodisca vitripennis]
MSILDRGILFVVSDGQFTSVMVGMAYPSPQHVFIFASPYLSWDLGVESLDPLPGRRDEEIKDSKLKSIILCTILMASIL